MKTLFILRLPACFLCFLLLAVSNVVLVSDADELQVSSTRPVLHSFGEQPITYEYPSIRTSLTNETPEDIVVSEVVFHLQGPLRVDQEAKLVLQIAPYFDSLAVKALNIGWGPYGGKSFSLFDQDETTDNGTQITKLFDLNSVERPLKTVEREEMMLFKLGPNADGFSFSRYGDVEVPKPIMQPGIGRYSQSYHTTSSRGMVSFRSYTNNAYPGYSGAVTFNSRLDGSIHPLYGKRLQRIPLGLEEQFLNAQLGASLDGGIFRDWFFLFGLVKPVFKQVPGTRTYNGITVDFGDGTTPCVRADLNLLIPGVTSGGKRTRSFQIEFLTAKSADFQVKAEFKYRVGNSESVASKWKPDNDGTWVLKTTVPRLIPFEEEKRKDGSLRSDPFDNVEFGDFISRIRDEDPNLEKRAHDWLERLFSHKDGFELRRFDQLLHPPHEKIADAFSLVLVSSKSSQAQAWLTEIVAQLIADMEQRKAIHPMGKALFPLICKLRARDAAYIALYDAWATCRFTDLLATCLSVNETRRFMPNYRHQMEKQLFDCRRIIVSEDLALATAVAIQSTRADQILSKMIGDPSSPKVTAIMVWAANFRRNHGGIKLAIQKKLQAPSPQHVADRDVEAIIRTLTLGRDDRFVAEIVDWLHNQRQKPVNYVGVLAAFEYLRRVAKNDLPTDTLSEFEAYPYSSRVREAAASLLGRPQNNQDCNEEK